MRVYKLTDKNMRTCGGLQWKLGYRSAVAKYTGVLYTEGGQRSYADPLLAVFLDPININFGSDGRMFEAHTGRRFRNAVSLAVVSESLTLVEEIPLPELTGEQRLETAIRMARDVVAPALPIKPLHWEAWADAWLSGKDRTAKSARSAFYEICKEAEITWEHDALVPLIFASKAAMLTESGGRARKSAHAIVKIAEFCTKKNICQFRDRVVSLLYEIKAKESKK